MSYFHLEQRVPERSALDPRMVTWFYGLISLVPLVRTVHRRFVDGVLARGITAGVGLDLGTGPGYVATEIARRQPGLRIVGMDLSAHMVEKASRQASQAGLDGRGIWPQGDGHHLPFADATFDLVVSSFALHHWDDPLNVLDEMARVLKPGGRYYIADVCREASFVQRLFAYASIPAISLPLGSYLGYGGYFESVRAAYTHDEARTLLEHSHLPSGEVCLDSTWFVPIVIIASKTRSSESPDRHSDRAPSLEISKTALTNDILRQDM